MHEATFSPARAQAFAHAFRKSRLIYVASFSSSVITVYAAHANGDARPTATITGLTNPAPIIF